MTSTLSDSLTPARLFPSIDARTLGTALMAGVAADLTWEIWARLITPLLPGIDGPLEPAALVEVVFGLTNRPLAEAIHLLVGFAFYPLGYLFIARPLQRAILPSLPWWLTALGFGAGLFVFALYVMAHLIAGFPPFLGWIPLAYASLAGHLLFGLVVGAVTLARGT